MSNERIVFEVEGPTSKSAGYDHWVCDGLKAAITQLEADVDLLDPDDDGDEIVIRCRRYTKEQMDEVIHE